MRPRNDVSITTVVAGPAGYLVLSALRSGISHHELLSTCVLANGQIKDPSGVVIARAEVAQVTAGPAPAAWVGDHWLVAYAGMAVPVADDGTPGTVKTLPLTGYLSSVSWDGQRALVTTRGGQGVFVDASGTPLGNAFTIFPAAVWSEGGSAVFDGSNHLVAWWTNNPATVSVASIASGGDVAQTATLYNPVRPSASAGSARLIAGSNGVLALYTGSPPSCALGGRCTPPVPYYRVLGSASGGSITVGTEQQLDAFMSATFVGGNYLLWGGGDVRWLDRNGQPTGSPGPFLRPVADEFYASTGTASFGLVPALTGSGYFAFAGPLGGRVTPGFALLDQPLIAPLVFPATQTTPIATFDGTQYLAVWNDTGRGGIHAARVSKAGAVIESSPIPIALGDFHEPFGASSGGSSVVGWLTSNRVGAARVSQGGAVNPLDLTLLASPYVTAAALGTNGSGYLLALGVPVAADPPAMRAAHLSAQGDFMSKVDFDAQQARPAVTFDGQNYVVVWSVLGGNTAELRAARFTPAFELIDTPPRVLFQYPADAFNLDPGIASDGQRSLVTWTQAGDESLRVARVSRELDVLDAGGVVIATGATATRGVATSWDGARYWIVWQGGLASDGRRVLVHGRRVGADAVPLDSAAFLVTDDLADIRVAPNRALGLTADTTGGLLLTYVQDDLVTHGTTARARVLGTADQGGTGGQGGTGNTAGLGGSTGGIAGNTGGIGGANGGAGEGGASAGESGDSGAAGETSTGGSAGRGGSGGGGQAGRSGASGTAGEGEAGNGGAAGDGQNSGGSSNGGEPDSGCGCSVPGRKTSSGFAWLAVVAAMGARRRRVTTRRAERSVAPRNSSSR
ncbi:MAG TPA: MYXO-CTERM sorting domain-containing protein [Polyangiaceae bacterium]